MENKKIADLTYLSTLIATELTKNKNLSELYELKVLLSQISCTISTIYALKISK